MLLPAAIATVSLRREIEKRATPLRVFCPAPYRKKRDTKEKTADVLVYGLFLVWENP